MRYLTTVALVLVGLVSVQAQAQNATASETATATTTSSEATATATAVNGISLDQLLQNGNVNLGNLNLNNKVDVATAIGLLMNNLCVGNFFNPLNVLNLGGNQEVQLLLQLAQAQQLVQLGFLNVNDIQNLFAAAFLGGGNGFNNGELNNLFAGKGKGKNNNGGFNFGLFSRAFEERKKTMKRTKLRRALPGKGKQQQQQCNVANLGGLAGITGAATGAQASATSTSSASAAEESSKPGQFGAEGRR